MNQGRRFDSFSDASSFLPFHNVSKLTFARLPDDPPHIRRNLVGYAEGFIIAAVTGRIDVTAKEAAA